MSLVHTLPCKQYLDLFRLGSQKTADLLGIGMSIPAGKT